MRLLYCPACRNHLLDAVPHGNVEIDACMHCGGLWFERDELEKVLETYEPTAGGAPPLVATLGESLGEKGRVCPECRIPIPTYRFQKDANLEIDVCPECQGIWLDRGELEQAMAFSELPDAMEMINRERTWGTWFFQFLFQLPVEYNIKPRRFPAVTSVLLLLNTVILMVEFMAPDGMAMFQQLAMVPADLGTPHWFLTLVTYQFLHAGLFHLVGNMYFLYILGDNLEDVLGRGRYLAFYLVCGMAAGVLQTVPAPDSTIPVVGASGAISGVMAGYMIIFRKAKLTFFFILFQRKLPVFWYFGIWLAINLGCALTGVAGVAWFAHIGGFAAGIIIAWSQYPRIIGSYPLLKLLNQSTKV